MSQSTTLPVEYDAVGNAGTELVLEVAAPAGATIVSPTVTLHDRAPGEGLALSSLSPVAAVATTRGWGRLRLGVERHDRHGWAQCLGAVAVLAWLVRSGVRQGRLTPDPSERARSDVSVWISFTLTQQA